MELQEKYAYSDDDYTVLAPQNIFEIIKEGRMLHHSCLLYTSRCVEETALEQAQQVIVDEGICKGMTIAQVAEKRPVNLRYYLIPGKSKNNMVRAAAQLVLNSLQKAG